MNRRRRLLFRFLLRKRRRHVKRKYSFWIRAIFRERKQTVEFSLLLEMYVTFHHRVSMNPSKFDFLLSKVGPVIKKRICIVATLCLTSITPHPLHKPVYD